MQVHNFYNGLSAPTRTLFDASDRRAIMGRNEVEAYQILENIALNNCQWPVERVAPKKQTGAYDSDVFTKFSAQVSTLSKQCKLYNKKGLKYLHIWLKKVRLHVIIVMELIPPLNVQ